MSVPITLLYAPADKPERFLKALESGAHAVIFDLEDAVAAGRKDEARANLASFFADAELGPQGYLTSTGRSVSLQLRINVRGSQWHAEDLALVRGLPASVGVRIPKATTAEQVVSIAQEVDERPVFLLLENALGVENALALATAHPQVAGLSLGEADLRSELGIQGDKGLEYARSRVVYASRAAGLEPPSMAVYASVSDLDGLAASCLEGKALGMLGRTAIHPKQLTTIVSAFMPSEAEIERARAVIATLGHAQGAGSGTAVLADGTFLDAAMVQLAKRTVALSQLVESSGK